MSSGFGHPWAKKNHVCGRFPFLAIYIGTKNAQHSVEVPGSVENTPDSTRMSLVKICSGDVGFFMQSDAPSLSGESMVICRFFQSLACDGEGPAIADQQR